MELPLSHIKCMHSITSTEAIVGAKQKYFVGGKKPMNNQVLTVEAEIVLEILLTTKGRKVSRGRKARRTKFRLCTECVCLLGEDLEHHSLRETLQTLFTVGSKISSRKSSFGELIRQSTR